MRIRILVADQSEASFYDVEHREDMPRPAGHLSDPIAHLHERDLTSDRPGRVFDHAPSPGHRRGAVGHHGTGGERSARKHEAMSFARRIGGELERARENREFDRLVVMAAPGFLGLLRETLPDHVRASVAAEVPKDLVHEPLDAVKSHLPPDAFHVTPH